MSIGTIVFISPIIIIFAILGWAQFFLNDYIHHEKIKNPSRLIRAASNATILIIMLVIIVLFLLYLFFGGLFN